MSSAIWYGTVLVALLPATVMSYTWPSPRTDYLETILYQQTGFREEPMSFGVVPCSRNIFPGVNRTTSAEWFRTAYHDMATADVEAGTGGLDGSIGFETDRAENIGSAFNGSMSFFVTHQSARGSMADLVALGAQMALASCTDGRLQVPFRAGRIDATEAGPLGVPEPQQDLDSHISSFKKQGFNVSEMIGLVACGHSLGGVHGVDFPEVVDQPEEEDINNLVSFDGTIAHFDNTVAIEFIGNVSQNPLAFGHNHTTRSDARIFNADGGEMIRKMAESNDFFVSTCSDLVERMINTVPKEVQLTEIIEPIDVKPDHLQIAINSDGTMTLSGEIRIRDDLFTSPTRSVGVHIRSRDDLTSHRVEAWTDPSFVAGALYPNMPSFTFYKFDSTIPTSQGVSSFHVELVDGFIVKHFDNNGNGFPWDDTMAPQLVDSNLSCQKFETFVSDDLELTVTHTLRLAAAMRNDAGFDTLMLAVPQPFSMSETLSVRFEPSNQVMEKGDELDGTGYSMYHGEFVFELNAFGPTKTYDLLALGPERLITSGFHWYQDVPECPF